MVKSVIKEMFIIILLIVAIILLLGILFYDYRPAAKQIPTKVDKYVLPEEMKEELNETIEGTETQNIVKTYRVDASDLEKYEENDQYNRGRVHPFGEVYTKPNTEGNTTGDGNSTGTDTDSENGGQGNFLNMVK